MYFTPATASAVHMWPVGVEQTTCAIRNKVNQVEAAPDRLLAGSSNAATSTEGAAA
jgi:hypothetical protein